MLLPRLLGGVDVESRAAAKVVAVVLTGDVHTARARVREDHGDSVSDNIKLHKSHSVNNSF